MASFVADAALSYTSILAPVMLRRTMSHMELLQLVGRYFRLKRELVVSMREKPANPARVERLQADLSAARAEVFSRRQVDEQSGDSLPFLASAFIFQTSQFEDGG
jgi:hypothetical protein